MSKEATARARTPQRRAEATRAAVAAAAIVTVAIVAAIWFLLVQINDMIEDRGDQLTLSVAEITGKAGFHPKGFWTKLEAGIEKAADPANDLPPERKARLMEAIRVLADRWDRWWRKRRAT